MRLLLYTNVPFDEPEKGTEKLHWIPYLQIYPYTILLPSESFPSRQGTKMRLLTPSYLCLSIASI